MSVDLSWLIAAALLSVRVATATAFTAVLGPTVLPGSVRILLAAGLGILLASATGTTPRLDDSPLAIALACVQEVLIGAALGVGFLCAYAATQIAGRILDTQMGFLASKTETHTAIPASFISRLGTAVRALGSLRLVWKLARS